MRIEHIALWSPDIERLKDFYTSYFGAKANDRYENHTKGFKSYFLSFGEESRLEIMNMGGISCTEDPLKRYWGYCHLAIGASSVSEVIRLTGQLRDDGYEVVSEPRTTGDGYFESVVLDPDGNRIEIVKDSKVCKESNDFENIRTL